MSKWLMKTNLNLITTSIDLHHLFSSRTPMVKSKAHKQKIEIQIFLTSTLRQNPFFKFWWVKLQNMLRSSALRTMSVKNQLNIRNVTNNFVKESLWKLKEWKALEREELKRLNVEISNNALLRIKESGLSARQLQECQLKITSCFSRETSSRHLLIKAY